MLIIIDSQNLLEYNTGSINNILTEGKMEVTQKRDDNILIVKIKGRVDTNTAPELMPQLDLKDVKELIFDMSEVDYVFSAGLRAFLQAQKMMNLKQGKMKLIHVDPSVKSIFEMVGFADIMDID